MEVIYICHSYRPTINLMSHLTSLKKKICMLTKNEIFVTFLNKYYMSTVNIEV